MHRRLQKRRWTLLCCFHILVGQVSSIPDVCSLSWFVPSLLLQVFVSKVLFAGFSWRLFWSPWKEKKKWISLRITLWNTTPWTCKTLILLSLKRCNFFSALSSPHFFFFNLTDLVSARFLNLYTYSRNVRYGFHTSDDVREREGAVVEFYTRFDQLRVESDSSHSLNLDSIRVRIKSWVIVRLDDSSIIRYQ